LAWKIKIGEAVKKDLSRLDKPVAKRILNFLGERVAVQQDPRGMGEPLKGSLSGLWKYRVGHYGIICEIQEEAVTVLAVRVGHRREVYR